MKWLQVASCRDVEISCGSGEFLTVYGFNFVISAHSQFVNISGYGHGQRRTMIDDNALNEMTKNFNKS